MLKTAIDPKTTPARPLRLALYLCLLLLPLAGHAQGIDGCDVISARITCPEYDAFNTGETYVDGWITVACGTAATVTIAIGPGASGDVVNRTMTMTGENPLKYHLYTDPARNQLWGDGTSGATVTVTVSANTEVHVPVYGRIPDRQQIASGGYSDSPVITLTW